MEGKDQVLEKFKELLLQEISLVSKLKLYILTMVVSIVPKNSTRILRRKALSIRKDESHTIRISQINDVSP